MPSRVDHCLFRHQKGPHRLPGNLDAAAWLGRGHLLIRRHEKLERLAVDQPRLDFEVAALVRGGDDHGWSEIAALIGLRDPDPLRPQHQDVANARLPANRRLTVDISSGHARTPAGGTGLDALRLQYRAEPDESSHESVGWSLEQFARRPDLLDSAGPQNRDTVTERKRLILVVSDGKKGRAKPAMQATDLVAQLPAQVFIEPRQWLIEEENGGVQDQCARESNTLTLSSGELVHAAPLVTFKGDDSKHLGRAPPSRRRIDAAHPEAVGDVLRDGHVRKQAKVLEDGIAGSFVRRKRRHVRTAEKDATCGRLQEAADHLQNGGLARAGRTQQSDEAALLHLQRDVGNGGFVIDLRHTVEGDGGGRTHPAPSIEWRPKRSGAA